MTISRRNFFPQLLNAVATRAAETLRTSQFSNQELDPAAQLPAPPIPAAKRNTHLCDPKRAATAQHEKPNEEAGELKTKTVGDNVDPLRAFVSTSVKPRGFHEEELPVHLRSRPQS